MEAIFHEKQEGSLCAQHCLNTLLQNQYFTAVDLASIGQNLDEQERQHMMEGGVETSEYQHFLEQPSSNYDDSGFFSIQVLQEALKVWALELVTFTSQNPVAQQAQRDPTSQQAYICNFRQHWFCVRRLGQQWFNLNSLLTGPELISDTYLSLFLTQLQQEGYSLFIVVGELAECEADQLLRMVPAVQPIKPSLITPEGGQSSQGEGGGGGGGGVGGRPQEEEGSEEDRLLQRALAESRQLVEQDDTALQRAIRDSMQGYIDDSISRGGEMLGGSCLPSTSATPATQPSAEELRLKRLAYLDGRGSNPTSESPSSNTSCGPSQEDSSKDSTEEALLQEALKMSMQQP